MSHFFCPPTPAIRFPEVYAKLLRKLVYSDLKEVNARTGKVIHNHPYGPVSFSLDLSSDNLPVPGCRKVFPGTAAAELAWFLMGTQDADFMMKHARVVWEKFLEPVWFGADQGRYCSKLNLQDGIKAAYGWRWRRAFGRDQIALAVQALRRNPSDRRVYVSTWDPSTDGLGAEGQMNVPCPVGFTLSIVDGRLNSAYTLRSSDVFVGLPYDVMNHALLIDALSVTLAVQRGTVGFTLAHPHLYGVHLEMAEEALDVVNNRVVSRVEYPSYGLESIESHPDEYVEVVRDIAKKADWPTFCPKPEVVQ